MQQKQLKISKNLDMGTGVYGVGPLLSSIKNPKLWHLLIRGEVNKNKKGHPTIRRKKAHYTEFGG